MEFSAVLNVINITNYINELHVKAIIEDYYENLIMKKLCLHRIFMSISRGQSWLTSNCFCKGLWF